MNVDVVHDLVRHFTELYSTLAGTAGIVYFAILFVRRIIHI